MSESVVGPIPNMSSIEVLHNGIAESFDSSEFSLIPDPTEAVGGFSGNSQFDMNSLLQSATQDMSIEDIQKRLVELVEDNESMKKALKLNNTMMKEQLSTITEWHNQMTTSMSKQQINLSEAKEKISMLEKENNELRHKIKETKEPSSTIKDAETGTDDYNTMTSFEEVALDFVNTKCFKDEENLRSELKSANDKIAEMKDMLEMQTLKVLKLQKSVEEKERCLALCNEQNQIFKDLSENLKKQSEDCKSEIDQLRVSDEARIMLLEKTVNGLEDTLLKEQKDHEKERSRHLETKKTLDILQVNYDAAVSSLEKLSSDLKAFMDTSYQNEEWFHGVLTYDEVGSLLVNDGDFLVREVPRNERGIQDSTQLVLSVFTKSGYRHFLFKMNSNRKYRFDGPEFDSIQELIMHHHQSGQPVIKKTGAILRRPIPREKWEVVSDEDVFLIQKIRSDSKEKNSETIDELIAKVFDLEQKVEKNEEDLRKKQDTLASLRVETEAIPILKAQVEEYKAELDNAILSKESSAQEVERLKKELNDFQAAISFNNDADFQATPPPDNQPENPTSPYVCPLCGFGFDTLQAVENHVNECLDNAP